jgi:uncharacterized protein (TIGR02246 family)
MAHDPETIRSVIIRFFDAFAKTRDPDGIAACFTEDADIMGVDGRFFQGREAIRAHYKEEFSGDYAGFRTGEPEMTSIREIRGLVFADAAWDLFGPEGEEPIARPTGCFLMGTDKVGDLLIHACRVWIPASLG